MCRGKSQCIRSYRAFEMENIISDLRFAIDESFRKNDIRIPFLRHDVHLFRPAE